MGPGEGEGDGWAKGLFELAAGHVSAPVQGIGEQGKDAPGYCRLLWDERLKLRGLELCGLHLKSIILLLLLGCLDLLTSILRLQHSLVLGLLCVRIKGRELRLNGGRVIHRRHRHLRWNGGELWLKLPRLRLVDREID